MNLEANFNRIQKQNTKYVFLLYGQSGSGKSFLACQFPEPLILGRK